ncbi:MAG: hypothetical protein KBT68_02925, partial [bacterium]|nr:hypothetical protein [Candidatus Colisoma equi]
MKRFLTGLLGVFAAVAAEAATLPPGYETVEYIESTWKVGQYIDTEYAPKRTTRIVADFNPLARVGFYGVFFGTSNGDSPSYSVLLRYCNEIDGINSWFCNDEWRDAQIEGFVNKRITAELKAGQMTISDGTTLRTARIPTVEGRDPTPCSIYIFAGNKNGKLERPHAMKLYSFKIYDGEKLERDFVPCVNTDSMELGLYETVKGKFYGNAGKGAFQTGLPPGYDAVEYIESTKDGKQYINTGYVPKKTTKVECVVNVADKQVTTHAVVFGAQTMRAGNTGNRDNMSFFAWFRSSPATAYNRGEQEQKGDPFGYDAKVRLVCKDLKAEWSLVDGRMLGSISNTGEIKDGNPDYPLYIFALDEPNGNKKPSPPLDHTYLAMKLYSFKIYEGDNPRPVHDFVPCVEQATGKAGLYDTVGGKFYGNAGNGWDFLTEQPTGYRPVEYIESTPGGGQYIDTEYTANASTKVVMDAYVFPRNKQDDTWGVLFGSRTFNSWTTKSFSFQMADGASGIDSFRFAYNGKFVGDGNKPFSYGERITLVCDGRHVEWTGSKAGSVSFSASPLDQSISTLYIFGDNSVENDGEKRKSAHNPSVLKLYSFKIYEG